MPRSLGPIPLSTPIVDRDGTITAFFRQRWEDVGAGWTQSPSVAHGQFPAQTGALALTRVWTVTTPGVYRVTWYLRTTRADGVSSSVAVGLNFIDLDGRTLGFSGAAMTYDSVGGWQSATVPIRCTAPSDINVAVTYASATPGAMRYDLEVLVEFLP